MYIESIINDYAERSDIGASSFQFLLNMADDYKNQLEMESISGELNLTDISDDSEVNDLPF